MALVPFRDAVRVWLTVAVHSFGGPAGQIATMHRILVDEKRWISERRFLHALNYCMLLPGPEAMQLATYVGWLLHGVRGGLVAGALFVLPGFLAILGLSIAYALYQDTSWLPALFFGIKAAVVALVVQAMMRIGKRAVSNRMQAALAGSAFVAMFVFDVAFPWILVSAAVMGVVVGRRRPEWFAPSRPTDPGETPHLIPDHALPQERPTRVGTLRTTLIWLAVWWLPIGLLTLAFGVSHIFVQQGWFFSKTAVVTFGGAYAVLAYIAQRAVEDFGWLQPGEMLDGLGMAETTPGPLIQVVQFVGFMGAFRAADSFGMDPLLAGLLASVLVTWVTFVPCFLWIFAGAPYIEHLRENQRLQHALGAITAAVVGVILNLAAWFALHVFFPGVQESTWGPVHVLVPVWSHLDVAAVAIALGAWFALRRWNTLAVLAASIVVGASIQMI